MQAATIFIVIASSSVAAFTPGSLNLTATAVTIQSAQSMAQAASQTSDGRMQALAAASTALNVYNNAKDIGDAATALGKGDLKNAGCLNVSIGTSKSQSSTSSLSDTARGSTVGAGNNVNITATGDQQNSNILTQGSEVKAGNNTTLTTDNQINLIAARNESSQTSTNSNSASSLGASFSAKGISANASTSKGSGRGDGQDTSFSNTNVSAGNTASIQSGGNTNVIGAVVEANRIKADIGGSLKVESLQDTSTFTGSQSSMNASVSVGGGGNGASVGASQSNINSNFASVGQQSGLKAGDGGFQVSVANNTALTGAVITSTQTAVDNKTNTFTTGGALTTTDIQNTASFKGTASGATVGVGSELSKSGAGVGGMSGNAASTTTAGISGIAGNTAVRTGDAETGLKPIFDADKVQRDITAQVAITTAFTQQAIPVASKFADNKAIDLRKQGNEEEAKKWDEGGSYRSAIYGALGLLTGGVGGAAGAVAGATIVPTIGEEIAGLNLPESVRQGLTQLVGMAVGSAAGGGAGAASALPQTAFNYVSHSPFASVRLTVSKENARLQNECGTNCTLADFRRIDLQMQKLEAAGNLTEIASKTTLTTDQAVRLAENIAALLPFYGTPIALYQAATGKTIITNEDLTTAERLLNVAASAIPLGSAAYKLVTNAASDMGKMSNSIGAIAGFKSADEVNKLMTVFDRSPAWAGGTQIAEATLKPGTKVQMVVDKAAYDQIGAGNMNFVGNWASFDNIPNQAFARNNLAITNEFKKDVGYVVELEIIKPVNAQIGTVGSQGAATGGANQMSFLFEQRNGGEFFKLVSRKPLP